MSEHYIDFRDVCKTFDYPVLVDVNFHVDAGQTLDIGSLDLVICPQPATAAAADDQPSGDFQQDPN